MARASPDKFDIVYPTREINPYKGPYDLDDFRKDVIYIIKDFYADTKGVLHGATTVSNNEEEPGSVPTFYIMEATIPFEIPLQIRMKLEIYIEREAPNSIYGEKMAKISVKKISGEKEDLEELRSFFYHHFSKSALHRSFDYKKYSNPPNNKPNNNNWGGKRRARRAKTRARRGKKRSTRRRL